MHSVTNRVLLSVFFLIENIILLLQLEAQSCVVAFAGFKHFFRIDNISINFHYELFLNELVELINSRLIIMFEPM